MEITIGGMYQSLRSQSCLVLLPHHFWRMLLERCCDRCFLGTQLLPHFGVLLGSFDEKGAARVSLELFQQCHHAVMTQAIRNIGSIR